MKNKKINNKGITLIALIITIIVMLILVGVTVNVALNGGIFENAKQARKDTEKNAILEELIEMATWTQGGKIKIDDLRSAVEAKYAGSNVTYNQENGKLRITGKYGEYDYKVTEAEISIWKDEGVNPPPPSGETYSFKLNDFSETLTLKYLDERGALQEPEEGEVVAAIAIPKNDMNIEEFTGELSYNIDGGNKTILIGEFLDPPNNNVITLCGVMSNFEIESNTYVVFAFLQYNSDQQEHDGYNIKITQQEILERYGDIVFTLENN